MVLFQDDDFPSRRSTKAKIQALLSHFGVLWLNTDSKQQLAQHVLDNFDEEFQARFAEGFEIDDEVVGPGFPNHLKPILQDK